MDGHANQVTGDSVAYGPARAVAAIAALHDAVRAARVPAGQPDPTALEALARALVSLYNDLLAMAVRADENRGSNLRFDAITCLDDWAPALGDCGVGRTGEGGLVFDAAAFVLAARERGTGTWRSLRAAAGACACLCGHVARELPPAPAAPPPPEPVATLRMTQPLPDFHLAPAPVPRLDPVARDARENAFYA